MVLCRKAEPGNAVPRRRLPARLMYDNIISEILYFVKNFCKSVAQRQGKSRERLDIGEKKVYNCKYIYNDGVWLFCI